MTCIQTITCVLTLSILVASALRDTREYNDVHIRNPNEASADLRGFDTEDGERLPGICWACKWIVRTTRKKLGNESDQNKIRTALHRVCDKIGLLKSMCKKFVGKWMDTLIEEISTDDDERTVCLNLKACKSKTKDILTY